MPESELPGGSFEACTREMASDGHGEDAAEDICGALLEESKSEHGNVEQLRNALETGAGLIADVGVDLVSGVDVPAVDSKWVMTKSGGARKGHDYRASSPVLLSKSEDSDQRISYAAAMIPREPDKEGDVVATPTVEKAAHDFLKQSGGVDTDHSLIDGEGEVVESWVLKEERTFDLPGGETESYGQGTWMVGIQWGPQAWDRIKSGELTGLSIYGMAEHTELQRAYKCADCGGEVSTAKSRNGDTHKGDGSDSSDMGNETDGAGSGDGGDGSTDGPTRKELQSEIETLTESVSTQKEMVESIKDAVETEKADEQEAAALIAEQYGDMGAGDVLDLVNRAAGKDLEAVFDAIDSAGGGGEETEESAKEDGEDGDEDDDETEKETAEKRAEDANMGKGSDSRTTAAKGLDNEPGGTGETPSYSAAAAEHDNGGI